MTDATRGTDDRSWAVPVVGVLAVVVGVAVAGGGLFLLGTAGTCACQPPTPEVGADVSVATADGNATVTYDDGYNVDHLLVEWEVRNGSVNATVAGENASVDDGDARLLAPGAGLTLAEGNRTTDTRVTVVVRAVGDRGHRVVRETAVTL